MELTTYAEVVLAPAASDRAHPAFSNLFVQTELLTEDEAILCQRRPRSPDEVTPCLFHMMVVHGRTQQTASFETDRAIFLGRGNDTGNAAMSRYSGPLSNSAGAVLDPIMAVGPPGSPAPGPLGTGGIGFWGWGKPGPRD